MSDWMSVVCFPDPHDAARAVDEADAADHDASERGEAIGGDERARPSDVLCRPDRHFVRRTMRMHRPAATGHIERALNQSRLRELGALGIPFEAGELLAVDDLRPIEGFEVRPAAHHLVADQFVAAHDYPTK